LSANTHATGFDAGLQTVSRAALVNFIPTVCAAKPAQALTPINEMPLNSVRRGFLPSHEEVQVNTHDPEETRQGRTGTGLRWMLLFGTVGAALAIFILYIVYA